MAKSKKHVAKKASKECKTPVAQPQRRTISSIQADQSLRYKLCVLIYDLRNIAKDRTSEQRTLCTTDELYISAPYFTLTEAAQIKAAEIDTVQKEEAEYNDDTAEEGYQSLDCIEVSNGQTVEEAIKTNLASFFEKRRASGDSRPCGPHDMAPIYQRVFGISKADIEDDRFLSRLRRAGLST